MATLMRTSSRRRGLIVGILVLCLATIAIPVFADHSGLPGSTFEIEDGNLKVDGSAGHLDWLNVAEAGAADLDTGQQDDSFGEGTKEEHAVPTIVEGGIPTTRAT